MPRAAEQLDVGPRRGVRPHDAIHGRRNCNGRSGREAERRQQVGGMAVRERAMKSAARRRDEDELGPARELDVAHGRFGALVPEVVRTG